MLEACFTGKFQKFERRKYGGDEGCSGKGNKGNWVLLHLLSPGDYYDCWGDSSGIMWELVKDELGLPFLHLETDYSQSDLETLRVRIEAFLEMI